MSAHPHRSPLRLALVVQRYGRDIRGGAEAHCRLVARMLARDHEVTVLTTRAGDYETWTPRYPAGTQWDGPIRVIRFPNKRRPLRTFFRLSNQLFYDGGDRDLQHRWLRANGPLSPRLLDYIERRRDEFDFFIFFSFRYATTALGIPRAAGKALLVPTAEDEPAVRLPLFRELFESVQGLLYNSIEERRLLTSLARLDDVPGVVVGVGVEVGGEAPEGAGRPVDEGELDMDLRPLLAHPYLLYVGRMDRNKGVPLLYRHVVRWLAEGGGRLPSGEVAQLVLLGSGSLELPPHPQVRVVGPRSDASKEILLRHARMLVNASPYESLSMVLLEAWCLGRPVLVNGQCEVMRGQTLRAQGGLYFASYDEFAGCAQRLLLDEATARALGAQGQAWFRAHYGWEAIRAKYEDLFARVRRGGAG